MKRYLSRYFKQFLLLILIGMAIGILGYSVVKLNACLFEARDKMTTFRETTEAINELEDVKEELEKVKEKYIESANNFMKYTIIMTNAIIIISLILLILPFIDGAQDFWDYFLFIKEKHKNASKIDLKKR